MNDIRGLLYNKLFGRHYSLCLAKIGARLNWITSGSLIIQGRLRYRNLFYSTSGLI